MRTELVVPGRFTGPARSGNGGYCAGAVAALLPDPETATTVRLSKPPPLDVALAVTIDDGTVVASYVGSEVLRATRAEREPEPVLGVSLDEARAAEAAYAGLAAHPFPPASRAAPAGSPVTACGSSPVPSAATGSRRPGRRTRASPRTGTTTTRRPARPGPPSPGPRWTAPAAGRPTSVLG